MASGEEEELGDFEQDAECACAHGSSKRSWQFTVGSVQTEGTEDESASARDRLRRSGQLAVAGSQSEKTKDKSAYARSGYGVTGIKYQEEHGGESGKDRKIPEVGIPISPLPDPTWYPSHLAHVRRRRERARRDGCQQSEQQDRGCDH
jgi:hypothetical protein